MKNYPYVLFVFIYSILSVDALCNTDNKAPNQTTPLVEIQNFATVNSNSINAYDIAAHFSPIEENKINAPEAITTTTFGTASKFNAGSVSEFQGIGVIALSSSVFVVTYRDMGNSNFGNSVVGTVSGTNITYSSEFTFNAAATHYISVAALSSSVFIVAYRDEASSNYGHSVVGTVSGTGASATITYSSTEFTFNAATTWFTSVAALSNSTFVVTYRDQGNNNFGSSKLGTVTGTGASATITYSSNEYSFEFQMGYFSSTALSNTTFVVTYRDGGNLSYGNSVIGTVSGTGASATITYSSEFTFNAGNTWYPSVAALSSSTFVVTYSDVGNNFSGKSVVGTVSGTGASATITYSSSAFIFNAAPTAMTHRVTTSMNNTQFVVTFTDEGDSFKGKVMIGTVSGTGASATITYSTEEEFATFSDYPTVTVLKNDVIGPPSSSNTQYVIAYDNGSDGSHGYARIGDASASLPVELTHFEGQVIDNSIRLTWQTASEKNNEGFDVQRSANGHDWKAIGFVSGNGTTTTTSNYDFIDHQPFKGKNYYRLKQVDLDEKYQYSNIIQIETQQTASTNIRLFPNPATNVLIITTTEPTFIQIINSNGLIIKEQIIQNTETIKDRKSVV